MALQRDAHTFKRFHTYVQSGTHVETQTLRVFSKFTPNLISVIYRVQTVFINTNDDIHGEMSECNLLVSLFNY